MKTPAVYRIDSRIISDSKSVYNITEGDIIRFCSALQGIINRDADKNGIYIYQDCDPSDAFWYDYLSRGGNILDGAEQTVIDSFDLLWEYFGDRILSLGTAAWDPEVPATSNAVCTLCGLEGYLPVRYCGDERSLYRILKNRGVEEKMSLVGKFDGKGKIPDTDIDSTGSAKCDTYIWASEKYQKRCNPAYLGYILDGYCFTVNPDASARGNMVYSIDYLIMKRAFFFDLFFSKDEVPNDDPSQIPGTDYKTLDIILSRARENNNGETIQLIGFPFWWAKYSNYCDKNCSWAPVESEWKFAAIVSSYNISMEADAASPQYMTNASVYTHCKLSGTCANNTEPHTKNVVYDENTRYIVFYMGDYDSAAWMKYYLPDIWNDGERGKIPLMWGFNPNLSERCPMVFEWVMKSATDNDYIFTGDSGAGYVMPSEFDEASAVKFSGYSRTRMEKFNMPGIGFLIDGWNPMNERVFGICRDMGGKGYFYNSDSNPNFRIYSDGSYTGVPCQTGIDLSPNETSYKGVINVFERMDTSFAAFRTILKKPSEVKEYWKNFREYAERNTKYKYELVDPLTMFELIIQSGKYKRVE